MDQSGEWWLSHFTGREADARVSIWNCSATGQSEAEATSKPTFICCSSLSTPHPVPLQEAYGTRYSQEVVLKQMEPRTPLDVFLDVTSLEAGFEERLIFLSHASLSLLRMMPREPGCFSHKLFCERTNRKILIYASAIGCLQIQHVGV